MYGYFFSYLLIPLAVIGGIVYFIVYLARRNKQVNAPLFDWRRFGVGVAISIVLPCFIGFATSAVFNELNKTDSFITMVIAALIFLIVGLVIGHHSVISVSLIIGSIFAFIYALSINFESIPPSIMTILAGLGLALLIFFAYKKFQEKEGK